MSRDRLDAELAALTQRHRPAVELYLIWSGPHTPLILDLIRTLPVQRRPGRAWPTLRCATSSTSPTGQARVRHGPH